MQFVHRALSLLDREKTGFPARRINVELARLEQAVNHRPDRVAVLMANVDPPIDNEPSYLLPRRPILHVGFGGTDPESGVRNNPLQLLARQPPMWIGTGRLRNLWRESFFVRRKGQIVSVSRICATSGRN